MAHSRGTQAALRATLACALPWLAGSCALMDLGDYGLTDCTQPEQCNALNQRDGLGRDECEIWQCRADKRGCELRPRDLDRDGQLDARACAGRPEAVDCADLDPHQSLHGEELCDEADNDCDGLIDEGVAYEQVRQSDHGVGTPSFASYGQGDGDALYLTMGGDGAAARTWVLADGALPSASKLLFSSQPDGSKSASPGCFNPNTQEQVVPACELDELAVSAVDGRLIAAAINKAGVAHGQLRVGLSDPNDFTLAIGSKPDQDSPVDWAVDVVNWTDGDQNDVLATVVDGHIGARSPRIAALGMDAAHADAQVFALWLAASSKTACTADAPVVALGLWPRVSGGNPWLQGGNGGHGAVIGVSAGCAAPSIVSVRGGDSSGYAVAYPSTGTVELVWIARPSGPEQDLAKLAQHVSVDAGTPAQVALALLPEGELDEDGGGLLVAWHTNAGSVHEIGFAPLEWGADGIAPGAPKVLTRPAEITAGPVAAYAPSGFADADRSERTGGWLLVWVEAGDDGSRVLALRVAAEKGGTVLGEPIELERGDPRFPFVCSSSRGFEYGFVAREPGGGELTVGSLECEMP